MPDALPASPRHERLLAIDEPRLLKPSPLPSSEAEVSAISSHFHSPLILEHEKASRAAVLQALPKADVVHFSCHGGANWSDPENSGLMMANDEILTIKDLFELHLAGARLATLSACETGIPGTRLPDEVVSLPSAFIRAGFAGAIGSLWTVPDKSTAMLMTSFLSALAGEGHAPGPGPGAGPKGAESAGEVSASVLLGCLLYDRSMIRISRALAKNSNFICANNFIFPRGNQESRNAST